MSSTAWRRRRPSTASSAAVLCSGSHWGPDPCGATTVDGHDATHKAQLEYVIAHRLADLDDLAGEFGRGGVEHGVPLDHRNASHLAGVTDCGVEAHRGKVSEQGRFDCEALDGCHLGRPVHHRVHVARQPLRCPAVELADVLGRVKVHLGQEPSFQISKRTLDLPLALGVSGVTGLQGEVVVTGEGQRDRGEDKGLAPGLAELTHAVGAPHGGTAADGLEELHQSLQGVGPVDRRCEPPELVTAPAQNASEALQLVVPAPAPGEVGALRPVELELLRRCRLDGHRHRHMAPGRSPHRVQVAGEGLIRALITFGPDHPHDRAALKVGVMGQQPGDADSPAFVDDQLVDRDLSPSRRPAVLEPRRHRRRVELQVVGDLLDRPASRVQRFHIHVLLLGHHRCGSLQLVGCLPAPTGWGSP